MKLSIIIPLFNEEAHIISVLNNLQSIVFPGFVSATEIIIVDDASADSSCEKVTDFINNVYGQSKLQLIKHNANKGKGAAVKTALQYATGDVILIQDADLELSPMDIPNMLKAMQELNVPFINGSRYLPGVARPQFSFTRYLANKFFTMLTSLFVNVYLTDMACGYKLVSKKLFDELDLKEKGFGFEAELIIKCGRLRKNWIAEVPVHYFPRHEGEGKKIRNMDGVKILWVIIKYGLLKVN